jgi:predicted nucleic acid-binding Zn ribbon protein
MSCCSLPMVECVVCGTWIPYDSVFAFEDRRDSEPVCSAACRTAFLTARSVNEERGMASSEARRP